MNALTSLPNADQMYQALVERDVSMEGVFFVGVKTTGIFCRPGCKAKTPKRQNVEFFATSTEALAAGYRACRRCRPLELAGATPQWLETLLAEIERQPNQRWTDANLKELGLSPIRVRRWFQEHHRMTFHAYLRARRIGLAVEQLQAGSNVTSAALDNGYESLSGFRESLRKWIGSVPTQVKDNEPILVERILTPLGPMLAAGGDSGLCLLEFADRKMLPTQFQRVSKLFGQPILPGTHQVVREAAEQIRQYFAGERHAFELPLRLVGTSFQVDVWRQLLTIGYGATSSYQELAQRLGKPNASRAVGRANGDNRFAVVVPCHRVVRGDGHLCGYAGGLWRKQWLLDWERKQQHLLKPSAR